MKGALPRHRLRHADSRWDSELCLIRAEDREGLPAAIDEAIELARDYSRATIAQVARTLLETQPNGRACLAIVATDVDQWIKKARHAKTRLAKTDCMKIHDRSGIFYTDTPQYAPGRLGFMFPGEGCQYPGMLRELCLHFPEARHEFDLVDRACLLEDPSFTPSAHIFGEQVIGEEDALWSMGAAVEAVCAADTAMMRIFQNLELPADAVVGHSSGEYVALEMAGVLQFADDEDHVGLICDGYRNIRHLEQRADIPEGRLIAVGGTDEEHIHAVLESYPGRVLLAMHNCPHQFVLCAEPGLADDVCGELGSKGAMVHPLPFHRPYHTPWFQSALNGILGLFQGRTLHPPSTRLYSCATAGPFPGDPDGIRELCVVQWTNRVRFDETIRAMHEDGIRIFLDVGPRGNLAAFVQDILKGQPHLAVAANRQHRSSITQLHHALGQLAAHGVPMRLEFLHRHRGTEPLADGSGTPVPRPEVALTSGLPRPNVKAVPVREAPAPTALTPERTATPPGPMQPGPEQPIAPAAHPAGDVMRAYFDTMDHFVRTQHELVSRFLADDEDPSD